MNKIILPTASVYHIVQISEIVYCKSSNSTTIFHLSDGQTIAVSVSIKEFEKMLDKYLFFRIHQSYMVNLDYIRTVDKTDNFSLTLYTGHKIPVSTRKRKLLMEALNKCMG